MPDLECDVAVIGAGTAGLSAERSARRAGARTLLIDPAFTGTTCATVGCMPSKLLIAAADAAYGVACAEVFGVRATATIDGPAVMARVRRERDAFAEVTRQSIADLPDEVRVRATARFVAADRLMLDDGRSVAAKAIVIATGSRPAVPPPFRDLGDRVLTNETVFELRDLPASLAVIGAGPLGLELAQAFARLGVRVTVFDEAEVPGHVQDEAIADILRKVLSREMTLRLGTKPTPSAAGDGVRLSWPGGAETFERVLVATGRPPALEGLGLEATGLACDEHGTPLFDRQTMRCGASTIFLAGDADAERPVLHEASSEGAIAGHNAATLPHVEPAKRCAPFSIMFTDPPLAVVGAPPGVGSVTGEASYADQGRAKAMARNVGLVRLQADAADGRLLGATLLAPGAEHLAHLLAWAIEAGHTASRLLALPFYHPTLEEGLKPALRQICAAVHAETPGDRDEGNPAGG